MVSLIMLMKKVNVIRQCYVFYDPLTAVDFYPFLNHEYNFCFIPTSCSSIQSSFDWILPITLYLRICILVCLVWLVFMFLFVFDIYMTVIYLNHIVIVRRLKLYFLHSMESGNSIFKCACVCVKHTVLYCQFPIHHSFGLN